MAQKVVLIGSGKQRERKCRLVTGLSEMTLKGDSVGAVVPRREQVAMQGRIRRYEARVMDVL
jgi:hypothetical protein